MRTNVIQRLALLAVIISLGTVQGSAGAEVNIRPSRRVESSLAHLLRWLDTGPDGPVWRDYLQTEQLLGELAKGDQADMIAVAEIYGIYARCEEARQSEPFIRVRESLKDWLGELPPPSVDRLAAACRVAKTTYVARSQADLAQAKAGLLAAVGRLDARLNAAPQQADAWRLFLHWDAMQDQLAPRTEPDLTVLDAVYAKYVSGYEGLGLIWFDDLRLALKQFLYTARAMENPLPRSQYEGLLDALAQRVETYHKSPQADNAIVIGQAIAWLHDAGQAEWLIRALRHHFSRPNLSVQVSSDLIAAGMDRQVDDIEPVRDCILGTDIHATGHTVGQVDVCLGPSPHGALIYALMSGTAETKGIGYHGPVRIYNTGRAEVSSRKAIMVDSEHVWASPAESHALLTTTITDIKSRRGSALIEKFAWRRARKQKPQADLIATRHAETRICRRVDAEADPLVERLNEAYQTKFRRPLRNRKLFPQQFDLSSTEAAIEVLALEAGPFDLAAPAEPPPLTGQHDLAIRVHQSMVDNLAAHALGGMILEEERVQAALIEMVGELPQRFQAEKGGESWGITFARRKPITVAFEDNRFTMTIRGRKFARDGKEYPGMNVSVSYRIEENGEGFRAVRQAQPEILPPGFVPGRGTLSAQQQVLRTMLQSRMEKIFPEAILPEPISFEGDFSKAGQLLLTEWKTTDGWLVMGWNRSP